MPDEAEEDTVDSKEGAAAAIPSWMMVKVDPTRLVALVTGRAMKAQAKP